MPRQARLDAPGVLHHIMVRGIERKHIFRTNTDREDFLARLSTLLPETQTACYAWALIPNHAHFLLRSGPSGIAALMRKLLTGYAVSFNHRHSRHGQLFQNRYKSVVCEADVYLKELVRYIHLNPIRAHLVSNLSELNRFPYSGHSALVGARHYPWQDTEYVLRLFGAQKMKARSTYLSYAADGLTQGRREDLVGGGLMRSCGGWAEAKQSGVRPRIKGDERILGSSDFVLKLLHEADERFERRYALRARGYTLDHLAERICVHAGLKKNDLLSPSRQKAIVEARSIFSYLATRELGVTVTRIAGLCRQTPSAISYAVARGKGLVEKKEHKGLIRDVLGEP